MEGGYLGPNGTIARLHDHFEKCLKAIEQRHPDLLCGPYGIGAMVAFTPFGGHERKVKEFIHALFDAGVISFYAGTNPCRVRFLIPVGAVGYGEIDAVASILEETLVTMPV
jgi:acetylornithine/succinyldiaminopimelate/putrescine aminotransferase